MSATRAKKNKEDSMSESLFLNDEQLRQLTGRRHKSRQIEWLRAEAVPFRVNASGHPVVTRSAIEGRQESAMPQQQEKPRWTPRVVGAH
ncbi:DUF4224 domain-containing protein [Delftia deserti]|uniref:DUF4224 domain-containing protein n=1 Tax=Delftia deserti TaxID=1651218 RepID=A0ABW5EUI2_9BURK